MWSTVELVAVERWPRWSRSQAGSTSGPPRPSPAATRGSAAGCGRPRLWHTLDTELTAAEVLRLARENLERVAAEIRTAAAEMVGGRADDDTVRLALGRLADEHPDDRTIVGLAERTLDGDHRVRPRRTTSCRLWTIPA